MFTSEIIVVFGILSKITNRIISVILITCMDKVIEIPSPIHLVTIVAIYLPTFAYDSTFAWNIWVYVEKKKKKAPNVIVFLNIILISIN